MKTLLRLLIVLLALGLAGPAAAWTPDIRVTISETATGLRIVYDLPAPVARLGIRAADQEPPPRGTHLNVAESELAYRGGTITGAAPFRHATLLVASDDDEVDSVYPLLSAVTGQGFLLYAPYVLPDGPIAARVSIGGGRFRALSRAEAAGGYVLVGSAPTRRGALSTASAAVVPEAIRGQVYDRAGALLDFYGARLHRRLAAPPTIVITYVDEPAAPSRHFFRGDVTPNGIVFLRFHGTADQLADPQSQRRYTSFLAHELFHLWNLRLGRHPFGEAWLHEGAADYYSWIATDALWPGEIRLAENLGNALRNCNAFLADRALATLPDTEAMQMRYSCGPIVQWMADVGVRGASNGRRTGLDLWRDLLADGRGDYSVASFLAAADAQGPASAPFLRSMVETGARWDLLAPALTASGADVTTGPPRPGNIAFAATRAVVRAMCTAFWGAGTDDQGIFFDAEPCGLAGQFAHLSRIDGRDPMADLDAYLAYVRAACGSGAALTLDLHDTLGDHRRTVRCTVPPAPAPLDFRIGRALPLSPPARSAPSSHRARA